MNRYLKWAGLGIGSIVTLLVLLVIILIGVGSTKVNQQFDVQVAAVNVPTDAASIERGKHFIEAVVMCQECHGENYEGRVLEDDPVFGRLAPANLTTGAGGVGGQLTDLDYVRAIRHGVGRDGKAFIIMPSEGYTRIGDQDLGAMIAYLKSIPPVDNEVPKSHAGPLARIITNFEPGLFPAKLIDHDAPKPVPPPQGVTAEYGGYIGTVCLVCHGQNLGGQMLPDNSGAFAPNLTRGGSMGTWSEDDFINTIRTGRTPGGNDLDVKNMFWPRFAKMTDDELKAIWLYLQSVPPVTADLQ